MSHVSDAALTAQAEQIRDETTEGANTKTRVYSILQNIIDSKPNSSSSGGVAFSDWDASGNIMPVDEDAIGSGVAGAILKGDRVIFTDAGTINGDLWPEGTIGTAKQNSPTLDSHWRLY